MKIFVLLFIFLSSQAFSNVLEDLQFTAGVNLDYALYNSELNFNNLNSIPNSGDQIISLNDMGFKFGIFSQIYLHEYVDFQLRTDFMSFNSNIVTEEFVGNIDLDGQLYPLYTNHDIGINLSLLSLSPVVLFVPFREYPFKIGCAYDIGFLLNNEFSHTESIKETDQSMGIQFSDGEQSIGTSRNAFVMSLNDKNIYSAFTFSLSYDFRIGNKLMITPEVSYTKNTSSVFNDIYLTIDQAKMGLQFAYTFAAPVHEEIPDSIYIKDEMEKTDTVIASTEQLGQKENPFYECQLILVSDKDENKIETISQKLSSELNDYQLKISEWVDPETKSKYFRLHTKLPSKELNIFDEKNRISMILEYLNINSDIIIKSDE